MVVKLTETENRSKSNSHRLDKAEDRLDEVEHRVSESEKLVNSIALIAQRQDTMEGDVKEIKADVKALAAKPGQKWEDVVKYALSAIIGALVTYLFAHLIKGG